jgi:acyl-CoA thioester hydrolase
MATQPVKVQFRVRYSETDQMGTFSSARALDWFECGRTELLRQIGLPYAQMEQRGVFLPVVEAHVEYLGRARFDDMLEISASARMNGKASVRFDLSITRPDGADVARGYTVHAFVDAAGRPIRPPEWVVGTLNGANS